MPVSKSKRLINMPPNTAHEIKCGKNVTVCTVFLNRLLSSSAVSTANIIGHGKLMSSCKTFNPNVLNMMSLKSGSVTKALKLSNPTQGASLMARMMSK